MNENKIDSRVSVVESQLKAMQDSFARFRIEVREDIKQIKEVLLKRPSWAVTVIISSLSTISVSLIVYIVTKS